MSGRVVLASASPRRRDLLRMIGIAHEVIPADIDEAVRAGELPAAYVERLAREKGAAVARLEPEAVVISADTTVAIDGTILGKPDDAAHAERMLAVLAGRTHTVFTGVAVTRHGRTWSGVEAARVTFRPLSAREIAAYVATGEPMDKAGAYGIQGYGATLVERIDGDFFAVMGLALARLSGLLAEAGVAYAFGPLDAG